MIKQFDKTLASELVKNGHLQQADADQHLKACQSGALDLRAYLIQNKIVTENLILEALAAAFQMTIIDLKTEKIDPAVVEKVPVRIAGHYKIMPVKIENRNLILASTLPIDLNVQDELRGHLGFEPQIVLAKEVDIQNAYGKYYGLAAGTIDRLTKDTSQKPQKATESDHWVEDLDTGSEEDASVSQLVNLILLEAHKKRATDIHIEPYRDSVRVRYRIDGVLVDSNAPPTFRQFLSSITSRIKLMANLSIVEKRVPQDGSASVKTKGHKLDLRLSTIPTPHGESLVIRILPQDVQLLGLSKLGLGEANLKFFRALIRKPHGIILVTGPTGSGKTTTLYSALNEINTPERKIITLEDPLEYEMKGITQIHVNPKVNLTFAAGLRAILRHDPDIIMVGEIRDLETAEIAIRTALTGHLVFSTLHTNDAASGITRLVEMGVEPFLVASSVEAFIAQRLVRNICPYCREEVKTPLLELREEMVEAIGLESTSHAKIYQGKGCEECNGTGFRSRSAIYEVMRIDEDIRSSIINKERADRIKAIAMQKGMETLRMDGWKKVLDGITTPMEIMNVSAKDDYSLLDKQSRANKGAASSALAAPKSITIREEILKNKDDYNSRVYPRLNAKVEVRYQVLKPDAKEASRFDSDGVMHSSLTQDISAGGLRFVTKDPLPLGTILDLKIQYSKSERSIDCLAKVCRIEQDSVTSMYGLIIYYLDIPSADRAKLDRLVRANLVKFKQKSDNP